MIFIKKFLKGKIDNITIIDIDEKSINSIGQFPWRRDVYATIFKNLKASGATNFSFGIKSFVCAKIIANMGKLQKENNNFQHRVIDTQQIFIDSLSKSKVILPILGEPNEGFTIPAAYPKIQ